MLIGNIFKYIEVVGVSQFCLFLTLFILFHQLVFARDEASQILDSAWWI